MKPLTAFKAAVAATILTVVTFNGHLVLARTGGSSTGGGYQYEDTSFIHFARAQKRLVEALNLVTDEQLNEVAKEFTPETLNKGKLIQIIQSMIYAPLETKVQEVNGRSRPLDMTYSYEDQTITALQPLFASFDKVKLAPEEEFVLRRKILHESTHIFNIGRDRNQVSINLSRKLNEFLSKHYPLCGSNGTIDERILECSSIAKYLNQFNTSPAMGSTVHYVVKKEPVQIFDGRSLFGFFILEAKFKANEKLVDPVAYCGNADSLGGQIFWSAANFDQINQIDRKGSYFMSQVLLPESQARVVESGFWKGKFVVRNASNSQLPSRDNVVLCVGTLL